MANPSRESTNDPGDFIAAYRSHGNDDQRAIAYKGLDVVAMLLEKNAAYGSSAFNPISIFARGMDSLAQIKVRMDDKLARVAMGHEISDESFEDTIRDLAGYCILYLVGKDKQAKPDGAL